jgi:hypothetical protein
MRHRTLAEVGSAHDGRVRIYAEENEVGGSPLLVRRHRRRGRDLGHRPGQPRGAGHLPGDRGEIKDPGGGCLGKGEEQRAEISEWCRT